MDYEECKRLLVETRRKHTQIRGELREATENLENLEKQYNTEVSEYNRNLEEEKSIELQKHIDKYSRIYKEALDNVKEKISKLENDHTEKLAEINNTNLLKDNTDKEYYEEVQRTLNVLATNLEKTLGPRFTHELLSQLDAQEAQLAKEDLPQFITYFNSLNDRVERYNRKSKYDLAGMAKKTVTGINTDRLKENPINLVIAGLALLVGSIFFTQFVLPFYVMALVTVLLRNLIKNYKLYEIIIAMKGVQDNVAEIDNLLKQQAADTLNKRKATENKLYQNCMQQFRSEENTATLRLDRAVEKAKETFIFSEGNVLSARRGNISSLLNQVKKAGERKKQLEDSLQKLNDRLHSQEETLSRIAKEIPNEYLNPGKVGTDVIFDPKFIFDVKDDKPYFFEHPESSCLFLYNDRQDMIDFINLICLQLRIRMKPTSLLCELYDKQFGGIDFQAFVDKTFNLFSIFSQTDAIKQAIKNLDEDFQKKCDIIKVSFPGIKEYNKFMVESESVPDVYKFVFMMDPETSDISNEAIKRILRSGSQLGIFLHVFLNKDEFSQMGEHARNLVNTVEKCYVLQNGDYLQRAKKYIMENMIQNKHNSNSTI